MLLKMIRRFNNKTNSNYNSMILINKCEDLTADLQYINKIINKINYSRTKSKILFFKKIN